jgi:predicted RNA-binding Zn-ribbon protein involved in translation (DUF1610 family)
MLNFASGGLDFGRGGGDDNMRQKYLIMGGLVLLVVGSLGFTFWYLFMPHRAVLNLPTEYHMFCLNCNKEVVIPVGQSLGSQSAPGTPGARPSATPSTGPSHLDRGICPVCGKPALIRERMCPKCKQYYVTEWDKTHNFTDMDPQIDTYTCPNCGVNIEEYRKSHLYAN